MEIQLKESKRWVRLRNNGNDWTVFSDIFIYNRYQFHLIGNEPTLIIDAGANIGISALYFSIKFPQAEIIALEPDITNYDLASVNLRGLANVKIRNVALHWHNTQLSIDPQGPASSVGIQFKEGVGAANTVPGLTVDSILKSADATRISILKVDIEGAEREIFQKSQLWIDNVDRFAIEFHDTSSNPCSKTFFDAISPGKGYQLQTNGENIIIQRYP